MHTPTSSKHFGAAPRSYHGVHDVPSGQVGPVRSQNGVQQPTAPGSQPGNCPELALQNRPGSQPFWNSHGSPAAPKSPEASSTQMKNSEVPPAARHRSPCPHELASSGSQIGRHSASTPSLEIVQVVF